MAGIIQGFIEAPHVIDESGIARPPRKPTALIDTPTPIKSVWIQAGKENQKTVYYGESLTVFGYAPTLEPGECKEFIFKHDSKESPGDLADFHVIFSDAYDMISYLAITV